MANSIEVLLIGIDEANLVTFWQSGWVILATIIIVLVGRAAAVYGLAPIANRLQRSITLSWQHVLFWGGLRGALSMALALGLSLQFPHRNTLVAMTFSVVLFSLLIQGLTITPLLKRLGFRTAHTVQQMYQRLLAELLASRAALVEAERLTQQGVFSQTAVSPVVAVRRARIDSIEQDIEHLCQQHPELIQQQTQELERLTLIAERSALLDAERLGLLNGEDHQEMTEQIDERLEQMGEKERL